MSAALPDSNPATDNKPGTKQETRSEAPLNAPRPASSAPAQPAAAQPAKPTQADYNEFLEYLRQKDRRFQRPGRTVQDEFGLWRADREKKRPREAQKQTAGTGS